MIKRRLIKVHHIVTFMAIFSLMFIATWLRFGKLQPTVFIGDDLSLFLAFKDGGFANTSYQVWVGSFVEKYRPIFNLFLSSEFRLFKLDIQKYMIVNILVQALNASVIFFILKKISRNNYILAVALAAAMATSRFAFYQTAQVVGIIEGIALTSFLITFFCVVHAWAEEKFSWRWAMASIVAEFFTVHIHERYIVLVFLLPFVFLNLPSYKTFSRKKKLALHLGCFLILIWNVFYKILYLKIPFFVGTGGTHYEFDFQRVLDHSQQALFSLFGWNEGPHYLIALRTLDMKWFPAFIPAILFCGIWVGMAAAYIWSHTRDKAQRVQWKKRLIVPAIYFWLCALILAPPILTIRLEQRWLLVPFISILTIFGWFAGHAKKEWRTPITIASIALSLASIMVDSRIVSRYRSMFFIFDVPFYSALKKEIVDQHLPPSTDVDLIGNENLCVHLPQPADFFRLYEGRPRNVRCIQSQDADHRSGNIRSYYVTASPDVSIDVPTEVHFIQADDKRLYHED
jgi:hypothetical protein